ncbi:MAG: DsbA family protein [Nanoarchaeota archaeon]|nr:DsbA family protein [Nanoarchaeota archaeon]
MAKEKEKKAEENSEVKPSEFIKKIKKNPWVASTVVLAVLALILLVLVFRGSGAVVSQKQIGEKAVNFINTQVLQGQGTVVIDSVSEKAGLYEVLVDYNGQQIPTYFTKDGGFYVGTMIVPLSDSSSPTPPTPTPIEVPKSDKPAVELFIMTHCPYGTQAEKGILPAIKALGNSIDSKIRFVHYFMHGDNEESETYTQLCIREQQSAKFIPYLECFLEDGDSSRCLKKLGINVDVCINSGKAKEYYVADSALSNGYGVQGSPTLIINGAEAEFYPRSPASALTTICSAFNTEPSSCTSTLSTENPDPGFGTTASAAGDSAAAASC